MVALANRMGIKIDKGLSNSFEIEMITSSGANIEAGSPTKMASTKAVAMVDGDGTTSQFFTGIAKDRGTDTSAVAGVVQLWVPVPGLVYRGPALLSTLANTQALIDALCYKRVVFDLTSGVWSVDTAQADATADCVVIVGGNPLTSELNFIYSNKGSLDNVTT